MAASGESLGYVLNENLGYFKTMVELGRVSSVKRFLQSRKEQGNNAALLYNDCWAFRLAVEQGKVHLLQVLLEAVPDEQTLNALFAAGDCEAPFNAIEKGNIAIIKLLLDKAPSDYKKIMHQVMGSSELALSVNEVSFEVPHTQPIPINYKEFKQAAITGNLEVLQRVLDAATTVQKNAWFSHVNTPFLERIAVGNHCHIFNLFLEHMSDAQIQKTLLDKQFRGFNNVFMGGNPLIVKQIFRRLTNEQRNILLSRNDYEYFKVALGLGFGSLVREFFRWTTDAQAQAMLGKVDALEVNELIRNEYFEVLEEILLRAKVLIDSPEVYADLIAHITDEPSRQRWNKRLETRLMMELSLTKEHIVALELRQKAEGAFAAIENLITSGESSSELTHCMAITLNAFKAPSATAARDLSEASRRLLGDERGSNWLELGKAMMALALGITATVSGGLVCAATFGLGSGVGAGMVTGGAILTGVASRNIYRFFRPRETGLVQEETPLNQPDL